MDIKCEDATGWFLPEGAEILEVDGRQMFYATEEGLGSMAGFKIEDELLPFLR